MKDSESKKSVFSKIDKRFIYTGIALVLAFLAIQVPFKDMADPTSYIGGLLIWSALLEIYNGFKRAEKSDRTSAWISGVITLIIGALLVNALLFQSDPMVKMIFILFLLDGLRYLYMFFKEIKENDRKKYAYLLAGIGNIITVFLIIFFEGKGYVWVISLIGTLRILGSAFNMFTAEMGDIEKVSEDVIEGLNLEDDPNLKNLAIQIEEESEKSVPYDKGWIMVFILTLFFIHLGRMGFDRSKFGILSPVVAVIGDMFIALVVSFGIIAPLRTLFKKITRIFLKGLSRWVFKVPESEWSRFSLRKIGKWWIERQLRLSISLRKSQYSFKTAIRNGLKIGLPFAAILAAVIPVLGMSWYFDTENWASGIWDGYAGSRTVFWREAMVEASGEEIGPDAFKMDPEGMSKDGDFSFVIIGDTGEGDPSQLILKDQILAVTNKPDISFMVVSSDVIYPSGAMKDYERKFFLPFKGLEKPIYAIPGNHDWYDALDGFTATFFAPEDAKKAMEARILSEKYLTMSDADDVQELIDQAAYLRKEYNMPVGYQNAPFFQVSNDYFVFIAIDTGVRRKVDRAQLEWIRSVLEASKDKYVMALLGHPFYAIGEYQGDMNPDFKALHDLLREYKVPLVMAGDTHDLEYYKELPQNNDGHSMHHFVNGGGGAYLSIGAAMADLDSRPTKDWANYPSRNPLVHKIDSLTPKFKFPAWVWVKKYDGYPFSAEWLSAAFDYNQAPYFQSFMEIKVERSLNRIRLIPYGINGQLKWKDFEFGGVGKPASASNEDLAEWVFSLSPEME